MEENPAQIPAPPPFNPDAEEKNNLPPAFNPEGEDDAERYQEEQENNRLPDIAPVYFSVQEEDSPEGQPAINKLELENVEERELKENDLLPNVPEDYEDSPEGQYSLDPDHFFVQEQKEYDSSEGKNIPQDFTVGEIDSAAEITTFLVNIPGIGEISMQLSASEFQKLKAAKHKGETHFQATFESMPREQSVLEPGNSYSPNLFPRNPGRSGEDPGLPNPQSSLN